MDQGSFIPVCEIVRISDKEGEVVLRGLCFYVYITMSKPPKWSISWKFSFLM